RPRLHFQPAGQAYCRRRLTRGLASLGQRQVFAPEAGAHCAVFEDAQSRKRLHDLMRARYAMTRDDVWRLAGGIDTAEPDAARVGAGDAIDQIEDGRLSRTVRPNQAKDLSCVDVKIKISHGFDPAEALAQIRDLKQGGHSSSFLVKGSFWCRKPIRPPGANN